MRLILSTSLPTTSDVFLRIHSLCRATKCSIVERSKTRGAVTTTAPSGYTARRMYFARVLRFIWYCTHVLYCRCKTKRRSRTRPASVSFDEQEPQRGERSRSLTRSSRRDRFAFLDSSSCEYFSIKRAAAWSASTTSRFPTHRAASRSTSRSSRSMPA